MADSERMYGFFKCDNCNKHWESSHVYTDKETGKPYEQDCSKCNTATTPYRVERIQCSVCGHEDCTCTEEERKERHVDPNKPHQADLCHKCQSGNPCT